MEKNCKKCGIKLKKGVKFCTSCGFKVEEKKKEQEPKEIPTIIPPRTEMQRQTKPVDKIMIPVILVALILSIAAIIMPFATGGADISEGSIDTEALANNSVTSGKIVDGSITDNDIILSGISKIAESSIDGNHIIDNVIVSSHLSKNLKDKITGINEIANGSITSEKIADLTIDTEDIKNNSITSAKIASDAVDSSEIRDGAVRSSEIANGAITSDDIGDGEVTFDKMEIKIRYGTASVSSNDTINHNLGITPSSVVVTPRFDGSNYVIHANIVSITSTQFTVGLWKETFETPPVISEVTSDVTIYWIAMR
jgi:hypothetical protein